MPFGDGLDCGVDRVALVIARLFFAAVVVVRLADNFFLSGRKALPFNIASPKCIGTGKGVDVQRGFELGGIAGAIVKYKTTAVAGKNKRNFHHAGVFERLLHAVASSHKKVFSLDQSNRDFVDVEHEVDTLAFAARNEAPANDDAAISERNLTANGRLKPSGQIQRRRDVLCAGVVFAEVFVR